MNGADPGAGEHGDRGFRHHGHIDDHPIAIANAVLFQRPGAAGNPVTQVAIADFGDAVGDRAVMDDRGLVRAGGNADAIHMTVDGVEADIGLAPGKPFVEGRVAVIEDPVPALEPVTVFGDLAPERSGVGQRPTINIGIA